MEYDKEPPVIVINYKSLLVIATLIGTVFSGARYGYSFLKSLDDTDKKVEQNKKEIQRLEKRLGTVEQKQSKLENDVIFMKNDIEQERLVNIQRVRQAVKEIMEKCKESDKCLK